MNALAIPFVLQLLSGDPSASAAGSFDSTAAVAGAAAAPAGLGAGPIPSAATLASIRASIGPHDIRLTTTTNGTWIVTHATIDSSGIVFSERPRRVAPHRTAIFQMEAPSEPPPLAAVVPWEAIGRIEVGRSEWRKGAVGGLVCWGITAVGAYPLTVWLFALTPTYPEAGLVLFGSLAAAVGGGAALTAASKEWTVVWQPPGAEPWLPERAPTH